MGKVSITKHAIDRYKLRLSTGELRDPWKSLSKRIKHPELKKIVIPERIRMRKLASYAFKNGGVGEIWKHPDSLTHFVVSGEVNGIRHLVTVFERNEAQIFQDE